MSTNPPKYIPLEFILEKPRVRLLRALRFMDWIEAIELFDRMGLVESASDDNRDRDRHYHRLSHLIAEGSVEVRKVKQPSVARSTQRTTITRQEYRITPSGRDALKQIINDYEHRLGEGVAA